MMETTMESTANNTLTKWAVRLIGIYFFAWAISDSYRLLMGTKQSKNLFGFHVEIGGESWDFLAWVQVIALVLIGIQLFRFQPSGRFWAQVVLWMYALEAGVFFIWMTFLTAKAFYLDETMDFSGKYWFGELNGPAAFLLLLLGAFITFFIQAYFLTRKEVKQLFQKPVATIEANPSPVDAKEQSL